MDNLMQNREDMQEEELYALLDRAFDTERLCVSEELIQKTLKCVAEDSKVVSFEKNAKRKLPAVKYVSVAAAALFVAVLGVGVLRNGFVSKDSVEMEATYDNVARKGSSLLTDATESNGISVAESEDGTLSHMYYSTNAVGDMSDDTVESDTTVAKDREAPKADEESLNLLEGTAVVISADLTEALTEVGAELVSGEAEYWEFVQRETTWERDLFRELMAAMDVFEESLPKNGTYKYSLECRDGSRQTISGEYPLDGIVRIETKKGTLWGLLGETVRFYSE